MPVRDAALVILDSILNTIPFFRIPILGGVAKGFIAGIVGQVIEKLELLYKLSAIDNRVKEHEREYKKAIQRVKDATPLEKEAALQAAKARFADLITLSK